MKQRRKELGFSAEKIAELLGVSPATIYRYENGAIDKVPGDRLKPIADALSTTPAYLMGWTDGTSEEPKEPELDENYKILSRNAKKLSPNQLKQLLDMARVMFKEEFED